MNHKQKKLLDDLLGRYRVMQHDHEQTVALLETYKTGAGESLTPPSVDRALAVSKTSLDTARLWALEASALAELTT